MTPEQRAAIAAAEEAEKANAEGAGDGSEAQEKPSPEHVDHEAELRKERERREAAERKLQETREKARERWERRKEREDGSGEENADEEKPLTESKIREIFQEEREASRRDLLSREIAEAANAIATSETEASLMVEIHKNRRFPESMPLSEQMEEVYAIANRKRLLAQNEELRRSLRAKDTKEKSSASGQRETPTSEPKLDPSVAQALRETNYVWDAQKKVYKKVNGRRTSYFDPKTKRRWTA
jgi:hypothetical protein